MHVLNCNITINTQDGKTISYAVVSDVVVDSSIRQLTDTAIVTVPRKLAHKGKDITQYVKAGDEITIELGYDDRLKTVFKGFLKRIKTGVPVVLECENEAYALKTIKVAPMVYPALKLGDFVNEYITDYDVKLADANLGEVKIDSEVSFTRALDYISQNYPLRFYFRDGIFHAGLPSLLMVDDMATVKFKTGENYVNDSLQLITAEDNPVQIIAKNILPDNTPIERKEPGSAENAEVRTYYVPEAKTVDDLQAFAQEKLKTFNLDRMEGTLTAFGEPYVRKGDVVHLFDEDSTERDDKQFLAEAVRYRFGRNGYRQEIKLGMQL